MPKFSAVLVAATWMLLGSFSLQAQAADPEVAKIEQLFKQTGLSYKAAREDVWWVEFDKKNLGKVRVITSTGKGIVVVFVIVAQKAAIRETPQLLKKLLQHNHEYDYVKIGIDKDGDLFVRIDTPVRLIDSTKLREDIDQVANASEEVFTKNAAALKR
jgi:hypothetical protein